MCRGGSQSGVATAQLKFVTSVCASFDTTGLMGESQSQFMFWSTVSKKGKIQSITGSSSKCRLLCIWTSVDLRYFLTAVITLFSPEVSKLWPPGLLQLMHCFDNGPALYIFSCIFKSGYSTCSVLPLSMFKQHRDICAWIIHFSIISSERADELLHLLLPTLNANCNSTALAGWWKHEWWQIWGSHCNDGVGGNQEQRSNNRWLFSPFSPPLSQPRHLVNSNVTLLSDSQLTRSDHGHPQLVNVSAESNLVQA